MDSVQVQISTYSLPAAWTGGYERTAPDLCDIDADGDKDLLLAMYNGTIDFWETLAAIYSQIGF